MKILICGASGFVGRHLTQALRDEGHNVVRAVRSPSEANDIAVDFCHDTHADIWLPRLANIDVVINAVGVLRDSVKNPMSALLSHTPVALFAACEKSNVPRVIQVSALGVDSGIAVPYFRHRLTAEAALRKLPARIKTLCLRPSVIYGADGASAQMFRTMAKLPVQMLPMGGVQGLQPVHIIDVCAAVQNWLNDANASSLSVDAVGSEPTTMRGMLDSYRAQLGHSSALHIALPQPLVKVIARLGDFIPSAPLCSDTYAMLAAGNTSSALGFSQLLGREPKSFQQFIPAN
ncbi:MAG: NAD(P)H-binding protein [Sideroxydans sp.]|nr:NAD(P)H-binding protein [Sideroxydans sp.]